ncbi:hypothetical protein SeseC_02325 [Streptococcus equi subsp. zooepidemicus ATCC 35246]|nr:hypothetical protein SeseC_02325 [Streptococcus equi subsp. zooepidemicus ATCC 35246]
MEADFCSSLFFFEADEGFGNGSVKSLIFGNPVPTFTHKKL